MAINASEWLVQYSHKNTRRRKSYPDDLLVEKIGYREKYNFAGCSITGITCPVSKTITGTYGQSNGVSTVAGVV